MARSPTITLGTTPLLIVAGTLVVFSIVSNIFVSGTLNEYLLNIEGKSVPLIVQGEFDRHLGDHGAFERYRDADAQEHFKEYATGLSLFSQVIKVNIFDASGVLIWSDTERAPVGGKTEDDEVKTALTGVVVMSRLEVNDRDLSAADIEMFRTHDARLVDELHVPILGDDGEIVGVVEVYHDHTEFLSVLERVSGVIWLFSLLVLLLVTAALYAVFRNVTRTYVRDTARLQGQTTSLLQATLDSTADGILVVDAAGKITAFSKQFLAMWRIPEQLATSRDDEKLITFVLEQLISPEAFLAKVKDLYAHPNQQSFDKLLFKDGRIFERLSKPQILGDQVIGRVWSFRDVTEAQKAGERINRETVELERMNKLFVGRELHMIELKKKLADLTKGDRNAK